jgi:hypothetical protein
MTSSEPRNMVTLNSENLIRNHGDALEYCLQELNREHPDYQAAQVFATLSLEEAIRDLAATIGQAAGRLM